MNQASEVIHLEEFRKRRGAQSASSRPRPPVAMWSPVWVWVLVWPT
jgi:hypothetical protein